MDVSLASQTALHGTHQDAHTFKINVPFSFNSSDRTLGLPVNKLGSENSGKDFPIIGDDIFEVSLLSEK